MEERKKELHKDTEKPDLIERRLTEDMLHMMRMLFTTDTTNRLLSFQLKTCTEGMDMNHSTPSRPRRCQFTMPILLIIRGNKVN